MRILPILFNTPMVQAILDGRKTQTRRVVKYRPEVGFGEQPTPPDAAYMGMHMRFHIFRIDSEDVYIDSPYHIGDILYVRETWFYETFLEDEEGDKSRRYVYRASEPDYPVSVGAGGNGWRPSIHMPKEAARIFLRVTDVGVERLQDMRLADCLAEGVMLTSAEEDDLVRAPIAARNRFGGVWDSTIKPADRARYSWDANPWVWVYTFERIREDDAEGAHADK